MEELSALLIVFGFGAGAGTLVAGVLALLVGIYLNTRKATNDDEDEAFVIPYSALGGMGGGGGISMADIQKARAAMAAGQGGAPADKKDADIGGGNYI